MKIVRDLAYLPDPEDRHPSPLRPAKREEGTHVLTREPRDSEISWTYPHGSNYLLEYFEAEMLLKNVMKIPEEITTVILDRLWNFCYAAFNTDEPELIITKPESAEVKWPELITR